MLDQKTGRLSWGENKALWPGMTHADFEASVLYRNELMNEAYKSDHYNHSCNLKEQIIDGFPMLIQLSFDHNGYLFRIIMSQSDFYNWPNWPKDVSQEEYLLEIKSKNDRFLATQFQGQVEGGRELCFEFDWGYITSTYSFIHNPDAEIIIRIDAWKYDPSYLSSGRTVSEMMGWSDSDDDGDLTEESEEESVFFGHD